MSWDWHLKGWWPWCWMSDNKTKMTMISSVICCILMGRCSLGTPMNSIIIIFVAFYHFIVAFVLIFCFMFHSTRQINSYCADWIYCRKHENTVFKIWKNICRSDRTVSFGLNTSCLVFTGPASQKPLTKYCLTPWISKRQLFGCRSRLIVTDIKRSECSRSQDISNHGI